MKRYPFVVRKLLWFAVGFLIASIAAVYYSILSVWIALAFLAASAVLLLCKLPAVRAGAIVLLGIAVGMAWCAGYHAAVQSRIDRIDGRPGRTELLVLQQPTKTRYGSQMQAYAKVDQQLYRTVAYFPDEGPSVRPGDTVVCTGKLQKTPVFGNDGSDLYLRANGIVFLLRAKEIQSIETPDRISLRCLPAAWAFALKENLRAAIPGDASGLFLALVTGDRSEISEAFRANMSIAGVYHAISLSGMHVSLLVGIIMLLFGRRKKLALLLGVPSVIAFVLLSGVSAATVRAAIMQIILLLAPFFRREYDPLTSLSAALLLLLAQNPWCVANWGFQLSFLSTLGIVLFVPRIYEALTPKRWRYGVVTAPLRYITGSAAVSLCATVCSMPLLVAYFGHISLVLLPANILVLWAITICFAGGIAVAFLAFFLPGVSSALGWALAWVFRYLYWVISRLAALPFAAVYTSTPMLLLAALIAYLVLFLTLLVRIPIWQGLCCAALLSALCVGLHFTEPSPDGITALDVGQGQCIVCVADGKTVMIDCGGDPTAGDTAAGFLRMYGITKLDALVLTHFDTDHVNGVSALTECVSVERVYLPANAPESNAKDALLGSLKTAKIVPSFVDTVTELPQFGITIFPPLNAGSDNESGLCVLASHGGVDALITGDLPSEQERALLRAYDLPDLEVFVAGHHGAKTSTSASLLAALRPEIVLISVGKNAYGHPADEMVRRVERFGAKAYRTDENGYLTIAW